MPLSPEDLQHIAARTLVHCEQHAQSYWEGTRDHDISQNVAALLQGIARPACLADLDDGGRFRRVGPLLPPTGPADRTTALAGECVAQALSPDATVLLIWRARRRSAGSIGLPSNGGRDSASQRLL